MNALRTLNILDTPSDERFDRIARLAATHFGTPLARITFVDEDRTWYKACFGTKAVESPREIAICAHTVMTNEVLVSGDLSKDPMFCNSPQVVGEPNLRFYAGAPITLQNGMRVGSLCIIDIKPRHDFSVADRAFLTDLAQIAVHELELHAQISRRDRSLQDAARQIETARGAKQRFLSLVSHELKTPLNHVLGFGRILAGQALGSLGNEQYVDYARCICQSGERLEGLISRLLTHSSAEAGELRLAETTITTASLASKCRGLMALQSSAAGVAVDISISESAPAGIFADEVQVEEVVVQLLDNAIAFSPAGTSVELSVESAKNGGARIRILDRGPGVEPAKVERVMTAFAQGDESLSRSHEGIGLGLPMARAILELHGGTLTLGHRPGGGTIVEAVFPAHRNRAAPQLATTPGGAETASETIDPDTVMIA